MMIVEGDRVAARKPGVMGAGGGSTEAAEERVGDRIPKLVGARRNRKLGVQGTGRRKFRPLPPPPPPHPNNRCISRRFLFNL